MIKLFNASDMKPEDIMTREIKDNPDVEGVVKGVLADVKKRGDEALFEYTERFDKVKLSALEVTQAEISEALEKTDAYFLETLRIAERNIAKYHEKQLGGAYETKEENGIVLGRKVTPIERAGVYVPGGTASYASTVLMDIVPAKIAGVKEIIMVTPPGKDGKVPQDILAAASVAGATRVFKVGGAQAIAALAFGTETIPAVDKIVGPGNIYVATAKRLVYGVVSIDMIAGPSEILIIADEDNNPDYVAADLLSQAEHDILSSSVLVTTSEKLAKSVQQALEVQIPMLKRADMAKKAIDDNGKIIIVESLDEAIEISNMIAPEHLELLVKDPFALLEKVQNAGSVFLGQYTPEPLGDYMSGTNHTLPTSGTARFSSPLSVDDFVKKTSYSYYPKEALAGLKDRLIDFAEREGLQGHANAVAIRFK